MNNTRVAPIEVKPFQYKPYQVSIYRHTLPDGSFEYRHPCIDRPIRTYSESLLDTMTAHLDFIQAAIDMLDDDDIDRFGFMFESLLRDFQVSIHEADHFIRQNIGEITVIKIAHDQRPYRHRAVVDAKIEREVR